MSTAITTKTQALYKKYESTLQEAIVAFHSREFYAKYPEPPSPRIYGENANKEGQAAYTARLGKPYSGLLTSYDNTLKANEVSPYTLEPLGISYPAASDINMYITKSKEAFDTWRKTSPEERAGILMESLERLKGRFFEMAYATMHSTGQAFVMSFQASGPHSNDRALEALAAGLHEQTRFPKTVDWVKPMGKMEVKLTKYYKTVPLGIGLVIGCSTFPVWNSVPGLYASLVTGNTAIVKPHPASIYPLAIVIEEIQKTLKDHGFDPYIVQLAPDTREKQITKELAEHKDVKIIDFTGGNTFGDYIESIPGKRTFTEKAGINSIVIDSCKDPKLMMQNIGFSLSLYSGQMCTCPQNIYIPKGGIQAGDEHWTYEQTVEALAKSIKGLVNHEKMGPGTLGAIQSETTFDRVKEAEALGLKVILPSQQVPNPEFPDARIATTTLIEVPADKIDVISKEMFGPIAFVIPVEDTRQGVAMARELSSKHGAITFAAYCTDPEMREYMTDEMAQSFTSVSFNLVGPIWVNQSAGFSDFHVSGGNPAGNASLTDPEFVLGRFELVGVRIHD